MAENKVVIGATLKADGSQANETVKSFKAQLREANQELLKMQEEFGELSAPAIQAAKKVAELKDQIGDAQSLVDTFNPDRKFQAFGQSVQGVVGGFTALQGVMGLVGSDSEEVEKALLKVQSALAISQGLDDIREAQQGFKNLGAMIKSTTAFQTLFNASTKAAAVTMKLFGVSVETTSTSFKVLRTAIMTTGIGVLVVGLGFAIEKLMSLASASEEASKAQKELAEQMQKAESAALKAGLGFLEQDKQLQIARAKARGASEAEIFAIEQDYANKRIAQMQNFVGKTAENDALLDEIEGEKTKKEIDRLNYETEQRKKAADKQKEIDDKRVADAKRKTEEEDRLRKQQIAEAKKLNAELEAANEVSQAGDGRSSEIVKLLQEYEQKAAILKAGNQSMLELDIWFNEQKKAIDKKYWEEEQQRRFEAIDAQMQKEQEAVQAQIDSRNIMYGAIKEAAASLVTDESLSFDMRRQILEESERNVMNNSQYTEEQRTAMQKAYSDARIAIDEQEAEAKKGFYQDIGNAAGVLSDLIGKQTAVGKGLAIAQATINTWQGATEVLKAKSVLPEPAATISKAINFAAVVATGLGAVKNILKVNVPGGGGGASSLSAGVTTAPIQPQLPQTTTTALDQNTINQIGNQAIRAFVLETDVTSQQSKIREINRRARIG